MLWRNLDSGVLYEVVRATDEMIFIATECLQCIATSTLSSIEDIKLEVISGKWAAKYPIAGRDLQRALEGIESFCQGRDVHWITLSRQDEKTIVKMEFNSCTRDGGRIWDIVERIRNKYPEANYTDFRSKKLNRYEMDESSGARELMEEVKVVAQNDQRFSALIKEMEDFLNGNSNQLINLAEFNRLLYGSDYLERVAYAWTAAKKVTHVSLVPVEFEVERPESKIVGTRNGYLLFKRSEKALQFLLVLSSVGLAVVNYLSKGLLEKSEIINWFGVSLLLSVTLFLGTQSLASANWNLFDIARGVRLVSNDIEALQQYGSEEDFISDVYNRDMASFTFRDENSCALKKPNGMGWYRIAQPVSVHWLKRMGIRTFWRYDGSVSVMVCGVKRVAYKVAAEIWHVGSDVDRHCGPEVHLVSGSIGMAEMNLGFGSMRLDQG